MGHDPFPFQVLDEAFRLLGEGLAPLAVDGQVVGGRLPRRLIPAVELRSMLLHPSMDHATRQGAIRYLLGRARADGGAWTVALAGMLLPGLRNTVAPLVTARPDLAGDIEAEALAGLVEAIGSASLGERVAASLVWAAGRRAYRMLAAALVAQVPHTVLPSSAEPRPPWGHPDFVLADAVRAGVVSAGEAELIGDTRLDEVPLADYAARLGVSYRAAVARRNRAEQRLLQWLLGEKVRRRAVTNRPETRM